MERLPLELHHNIADYLLNEEGRVARPNVAAVSRAWQAIVEPGAFSQLKIDNTELETFTSAFSTTQGRHRTLLKHLSYTIVLPTYTDQECGLYENDKDRAANNKVVAEALLNLFNILSSWGSDPNVGLSLLLLIHSPMDPNYRYHSGSDKLDLDRFLQALGRRQDLFQERYEYSYIRLPDTDLGLLPTLSCITELIFSSGRGNRHIHPSTQAALTLTKTLNLQKSTWSYEEPGVYIPLRRQIRKEFVQSLETLQIGPSIRSFNFEVKSHFYLHHQKLPNLVYPREHDPLSLALHHLINSAQNLEKVTYRGPIDGSFFWPFAAGEEPAERIWPSVRHVSVHYSYQALMGNDADKYLPPGYGAPEETRLAIAYARSLEKIPNPEDGTYNSEKEDFRTWPNEQTLRPLPEAFTQGLEKMPGLLTADLTTEPASGGEWFIGYYAPGRRSGYENDVEDQEVSSDSPRLFFHMGDWRM